MRLVSFKAGNKKSYGAVADGGVIDLHKHMGRTYPRLIDMWHDEGLEQARRLADSEKADFALQDIQLLRPIEFPEKIICIGVNYPERNEEYRDNSERPKYPSVFLRTPDSFVGHEASILLPPESAQLDYEGEIVLVIGRAGRRIPEERAWDHVAGITCMNEGTLRDWVRHGKFNVTQGKNFFASGAIGPWIVTAGDIKDPYALTVTTRVNGEIRQHGKLGDLIFPVPYLISYLSTFMPLKPGDLIATGTPPGSGARLTPPKFLVPGDVVEVDVSQIGVLRNQVAAEESA